MTDSQSNIIVVTWSIKTQLVVSHTDQPQLTIRDTRVISFQVQALLRFFAVSIYDTFHSLASKLYY